MKRDHADAVAVMVHGIMDTGRIFRPLTRVLTDAGVQTFAPDLRPCHGGEPLESLAAQLAAHIEREVPPQAALHLIGFSMGALIARWYLQRLGGSARTLRFFSVAGPHAGTLWSHLYPLRGARQMRAGSPFLAALDRDVECYRRIPVVSYWTPFDLVILPPRSSLLPFAENVEIRSLCHQCLLYHHDLHADVRRRITSPLPVTEEAAETP